MRSSATNCVAPEEFPARFERNPWACDVPDLRIVDERQPGRSSDEGDELPLSVPIMRAHRAVRCDGSRPAYRRRDPVAPPACTNSTVSPRKLLEDTSAQRRRGCLTHLQDALLSRRSGSGPARCSRSPRSGCLLRSTEPADAGVAASPLSFALPHDVGTLELEAETLPTSCVPDLGIDLPAPRSAFGSARPSPASSADH